jgi:hypothetical protein
MCRNSKGASFYRGDVKANAGGDLQDAKTPRRTMKDLYGFLAF